MTATPQTRIESGSSLVPHGLRRAQGAKAPNRRAKTIVIPTIGTAGYFVSPPGLSILRNKKLTTGRMTRILRAIGLTPSQHAVWVGWTLKQYIEANPTWTESNWFQMVCENRELILDPPELETSEVPA